MKNGRNEPCPCGSGNKYKHCCLPKEREFPVQVHTKPEVINSHLVMVDGKWRTEPGLLDMIVTIKASEDVDEQIEQLFTPIMLLVGQNNSELATRLSTKLLACKHKLYACTYHLDTIEKTVREQVEKFNKQYRAGAGAQTELENPILIYETEAFLFQVKSNLDVMIKALGLIVPTLKNSAFKHSGNRAKSDYKAGGKIIQQLTRSGESDLANLFETHRKQWIQQLTIMRDTITHEAALRDLRCFIEQPYLGGEQVTVHYPTMPCGKRLDLYCETVFDLLCGLYGEVFRYITCRIQ